jgi:hypothetical protein
MPWTALHAALGDTTPDLSFNMIERACQLGIEETAALDWKSELPFTATEGEPKPRQQAELAKDIAAMANSGGGMIVFGVAETVDPGSSAAERIVPVGAVNENQLQQIRQVAGSSVFPPVVGLELYRLAPPTDAAGGVLALVVPDSTQAPHLVHPRGGDRYEYFMAPYRHGPYTERMVEQQIAAAYRSRDQAARTRRHSLDETWDYALKSVNDGRIWQVAVALPEVPAPRPREFTRSEASTVFDNASRPSRPGAIGAFDMVAQSPTRRGLQRFVRVGQLPLSTGRESITAKARAELHDDGTLVVAATRSGAFPGGSASGGDQEVAVTDLEQIGIDLVRLMLCAQRRRGFRANYFARIGISRATQIFRHPDQHFLGDMRPFDEADRVLNFSPVEGPILGLDDERTAIVTAFDVIRDVMNQAGADLWVDPDQFNA